MFVPFLFTILLHPLPKQEADLMELLTEGTQADCYSKQVIDQFALLHAKLAAQVTSAYKAAKEVKVCP